jgi:membrane-associated phospholipid phosphatase
MAIRAASNDVIAVTDAGVRLHPEWLDKLTAPFGDPQTQAVAGFFLPDPHTPFELAMGAAVLPVESDVDPERFMPSSRSVAFRRSVWEAVSGYPEWLDYCEDLILDFQIVGLCGPFRFEPRAIVYFQPRSTLGAYLRQYYLYARGDGKANLFPRRHLIRYLTYFAALPLLLAVTLLDSPLWLLALIPAVLYMFGTAYRRLIAQWGPLAWRERLVAALWVPAIRLGGDVAKMAGYPAGWAWRLRQHPPDWRLKPIAPDDPLVTTRWMPLLERDAAFSSRINVAERPGLLRTLAILITRTGDGLTFLVLVALIYLLGSEYWQSLALVWLAVDLATFLCVQAFKVAIRRPRPLGEWGKMYRITDPHSFPSGHSARGGALAVVGLLLMPPIIRPLAAVWGALIALSRVMLGVHYASDAVAGFLLGAAVAAVIVLLVR